MFIYFPFSLFPRVVLPDRAVSVGGALQRSDQGECPGHGVGLVV